jgi:hypothetical protein
VGLASIATGVIFYVRARSYSDAQTSAARFDSSYDAIGKQAETLQWVFYCAGGAALAAGATMYLLGMRSSTGQQEARLAVSPMIWPGAGGLGASGTF